jgi:hypothetical protein
MHLEAHLLSDFRAYKIFKLDWLVSEVAIVAQTNPTWEQTTA